MVFQHRGRPHPTDPAAATDTARWSDHPPRTHRRGDQTGWNQSLDVNRLPNAIDFKCPSTFGRASLPIGAAGLPVEGTHIARRPVPFEPHSQGTYPHPPPTSRTDPTPAVSAGCGHPNDLSSALCGCAASSATRGGRTWAPTVRRLPRPHVGGLEVDLAAEYTEVVRTDSWRGRARPASRN